MDVTSTAPAGVPVPALPPPASAAGEQQQQAEEGAGQPVRPRTEGRGRYCKTIIHSFPLQT